MLPKKEYFSSEVTLATVEPTTSVFDDENYDEEEEEEAKEHIVVDKKPEVQGNSFYQFHSLTNCFIPSLLYYVLFIIQCLFSFSQLIICSCFAL